MISISLLLVVIGIIVLTMRVVSSSSGSCGAVGILLCGCIVRYPRFGWWIIKGRIIIIGLSIF